MRTAAMAAAVEKLSVLRTRVRAQAPSSSSASCSPAFNTIFGVVLAKGGTLDVFIAGDDAQAKARVAEFIESLKLRPLDVGGLTMAHWLEATSLVVVGLANHGVGNIDFALGVTVPG